MNGDQHICYISLIVIVTIIKARKKCIKQVHEKQDKVTNHTREVLICGLQPQLRPQRRGLSSARNGITTASAAISDSICPQFHNSKLQYDKLKVQSMIKINSSLIVAKSSIFTWHQARLLIENISFSITLAELIIKEPEYSSKYLETKIKNKKWSTYMIKPLMQTVLASRKPKCKIKCLNKVVLSDNNKLTGKATWWVW